MNADMTDPPPIALNFPLQRKVGSPDPRSTPPKMNSPTRWRVSIPGPVQQDGDSVTIRGAAVALMYRAVLALAARHHRDGVSSPPLLHELRAALYRAVMSATGHELVNALTSSACCDCQDGADLIGVAEAATILSVSPRQARRLAAQNVGLGGQRIGKAWALRRAPVLVLAAQRKAAAE